MVEVLIKVEVGCVEFEFFMIKLRVEEVFL